MTYTYDAGGQKLQADFGSSKVYDYVAGLVYVNDSLEFIPTPEGRILPPRRAQNLNDTVRNAFYRYEYQLKDHLGNLRVACRCAEKPNALSPADALPAYVVQENQYDPWGLGLPLDTLPGRPAHRYKFQGQEEVTELGWYDYGARMYDAAIGRWWQVDPLAEKYHALSPYAYVANNPLKYIDPDGREIDVSKFSSKEDREILRKFLSTEVGYSFFAQFAREGDNIAGVKFDKTGAFAKDLLTIRSDDHPNMTLYEGLTQTFERKDPKQGSIYGKQLQNADVTTDISKGVIHLIRINANTSDLRKLGTLNHEAFVHVQEDVKRLDELRNSKIKPGTREYIRRLRITGDSEKVDHTRLARGQAVEYRTQSQQLDRRYKTNFFTNFYFNDVRNHKK